MRSGEGKCQGNRFIKVNDSVDREVGVDVLDQVGHINGGDQPWDLEETASFLNQGEYDVVYIFISGGRHWINIENIVLSIQEGASHGRIGQQVANIVPNLNCSGATHTPNRMDGDFVFRLQFT